MNFLLAVASSKPTFAESFSQNFLEKERYMYLINGLSVTLKITFFAVLIGILLGLFVAIVRSTYDLTMLGNNKKKGFGGILLSILNFICKTYLSIIRGTPIIVQLLIFFYVIFASVHIDKIFTAVLAFGINSGAYVAEIFRSGIMSIDKGQFEAGRSIGFNYFQTMIFIIMPQAFKNVLPALANEFVVLLKETSVAGWIGIADLTKGGDIIRSQTYNAFFPLIGVAIIYWIIVTIMTLAVSRLERRLRNSDH